MKKILNIPNKDFEKYKKEEKIRILAASQHLIPKGYKIIGYHGTDLNSAFSIIHTGIKDYLYISPNIEVCETYSDRFEETGVIIIVWCPEKTEINATTMENIDLGQYKGNTEKKLNPSLEDTSNIKFTIHSFREPNREVGAKWEKWYQGKIID